MLQINLVVEDEKISLDELQEEIAEFEDYVQSSDVAAMQSECGRVEGVDFFGF
jgi:elongation factor 1-beta